MNAVSSPSNPAICDCVCSFVFVFFLLFLFLAATDIVLYGQYTLICNFAAASPLHSLHLLLCILIQFWSGCRLLLLHQVFVCVCMCAVVVQCVCDIMMPVKPRHTAGFGKDVDGFGFSWLGHIACPATIYCPSLGKRDFNETNALKLPHNCRFS